jgi:gliding motility-associated-like protein
VIGNDSLYIKNAADYEAQSVFHLRIRSTLINGMNFEKAYTVYVTSGGEKPHAHNDSTSVKEDSSPKYLITATASDSDSHVTFTYHLLTTNVPFAMDSVTGKLNLTGPLNFHVASRYLLTFQVNDDNSPSRKDTAHIIVTVLPVQEAVLPINNYVSPNGDGKNDKLVIMSVEVYTNYELTIYNTSGVVVFHTNAYDNSWDGQGLDASVYYYTFFGAKKYKGSITLVK